MSGEPGLVKEPKRGTIGNIEKAAFVACATMLVLFILFFFLHQITLTLLAGTIGVAIGCALVAGAVTRSSGSQRYVLLASVMGVLAGLAPIGLVLRYRLNYVACPVVNTLSLPWPEPWRTIAYWVGGLVWLTSTIILIGALWIPPLRRAAAAMWIFSLAAVVPTFLLIFLTAFGDPGPYCIPG